MSARLRGAAAAALLMFAAGCGGAVDKLTDRAVDKLADRIAAELADRKAAEPVREARPAPVLPDPFGVAAECVAAVRVDCGDLVAPTADELGRAWRQCQRTGEKVNERLNTCFGSLK